MKTNMLRFYFDTYALIEIGKGNPKYSHYREGVNIMLNRLNLLEFSYFLFREGKGEDAKDIFGKYVRYNVDFDDDDLIKAAEMKFRFLKQRLSFVDCIGYILAKKNNAKFLTGDEHFRNMGNVEFVK